MRIRIRTAAVLIVAVILGGILLAAALDLWSTGPDGKKGTGKNAGKHSAEIEYGYIQ